MDNNRPRTWVYHATKEPMIVYSEEAQQYYDDGWADTPAAFFDLDKHLEAAGQERTPEVEMIYEDSFKGVAESLNAELNLELMEKKELVEYGNRHLGLKLSFGQTKKKMIERIRKKLNEPIEKQ
jgi:hypothetical protein